MEQQLTVHIVSNIIYDSKADIVGWVLVKYDNLVFIGVIKDLSGKEYKVKCMHKCGPNQFKWTIHSDEYCYDSLLWAYQLIIVVWCI